MRVRLKTTMAGPEGVFPAGSVADLPEAEAKGLVAGGYALALEAPAPAAPVSESVSPPVAQAAEAIGPPAAGQGRTGARRRPTPRSANG